MNADQFNLAGGADSMVRNSDLERSANPAHVAINGREYAVYFHHATGAPCTVLVHKAHHQTQRLNINGPTARAAISRATHPA